MFRGVVFDLDGVIVDSHPIHKRAWRMFLASVGKDVSDSDLDFILEGRRRREILTHFLGELSDSEFEECGSKKDEFFRQACPRPEATAGSLEFIRTLKSTGVSIAIATSASRHRARWTLEQLKIGDCFEVVVTGDDVVQSKPDPAIYRLAARHLSISPECLFALEDSVCGVRSAKSAGLRCLGIGTEKDVNTLLQAGADHVFPSLAGLSISDLENVFNTHARSSITAAELSETSRA